MYKQIFKGIKKNILYDLLNNNQIFKISKDDTYQWFDLSLLHKEIQKLNCDIHLEVIRKDRLIELQQLKLEEEND